MKVLLFEICEGAYNHNGSLTLVEAFDVMHLSQLPAEVSVGLAAKIQFDTENAGRHTMCIDVNHMNQPDNPLANYKSDILVPNDQDGGRLVLAVNVRGFKIPFDGIYTLSLRIDDNEIGTTKFKVVKHGNH